MRLKDKVAIVTGGSQGIGEAIARRYADEGAQIAIVSVGPQENAKNIVSNISAAGGKARAFTADCSVVSDIETVVREIMDCYSGIDILVNNAGVFRNHSIMDTTEDLWNLQLDLNLKGTFFFSRAVLPSLMSRGGGKIINISSIAGVGAFPNCPAYCASKGGVVNLTKALAVELAKHNINVNSIGPGNVATPMNEHLRAAGNDDYIRTMSDRTPTGARVYGAR
jgi:NAD(P)-dependent dehydrogenase (short-subunit alcohol dehydrogenase family)